MNLNGCFTAVVFTFTGSWRRSKDHAQRQTAGTRHCSAPNCRQWWRKHNCHCCCRRCYRGQKGHKNDRSRQGQARSVHGQGRTHGGKHRRHGGLLPFNFSFLHKRCFWSNYFNFNRKTKHVKHISSCIMQKVYACTHKHCCLSTPMIFVTSWLRVTAQWYTCTAHWYPPCYTHTYMYVDKKPAGDSCQWMTPLDACTYTHALFVDSTHQRRRKRP